MQSPPSLRVKENLVYNCDREITTISQLNRAGPFVDTVVVGGKNCLKLLVINEDHSKISSEVNVLEVAGASGRNSHKVNTINTVKACGDNIACGDSNGVVVLYKVTPSGRAKVVAKYADHKRTINSVDFLGEDPYNPTQLMSGSQDGQIKLWDARASSTKPMLSISASAHSDPVRSCQHSPHHPVRNKLSILSVHDSGALCKFDLRAPSSVAGPERRWNLHTGPALSLHVHPTREYVITGGRDHKMCIWNYSDAASTSSHRMLSSEYVVNTWGPVSKVRWSPYPNESRPPNREEDDDYIATNSLYDYDFACSYLNEDPTISVFNLNRKFIPKDVITTASSKPVQNFIWARNPHHQLHLWSVTKANEFISTNLEYDSNEVSSPLAELTSMSVDFDPVGDLAFVNQEKYEFELEDYDSEDIPDPVADSRSVDNMSLDYPIPMKPLTSGSFFASSFTPSPQEKPGLLRSTTNYTGSPSPSPLRRGSSHNTTHPKLIRQRSNSTVDSGSSLASAQQSAVGKPQNHYRKLIGESYLSPYVTPLLLPLPLNDKVVFKHLATNYILTPPDGFSLIDACQINATVSASVSRFRECQMWRLLAVSLDENNFPQGGGIEVPEGIVPEHIVSSVGSYQSNSTTNTNYGGSAIATDHIASSESLVPMNSSPIRPHGRPSFVTSASMSPQISKWQYPKRMLYDEEAVDDDGDDESPGKIHSGLLDKVPGLSPPPRRSFTLQKRPILRASYTTEDLDNENLAYYSSTPHQSSSVPRRWGVGSSPHRLSENSRESLWNRSNPQLTGSMNRSNSILYDLGRHGSLSEVQEELVSHPSTSHLTRISELTRAIRTSQDIQPWDASVLLKKNLEYAQLQGDVLLCATITILFYPVFSEVFTGESALNMISMYVDTLRQRQLFVEASHVIRSTPRQLQPSLVKKMPHDVNLRFYCEHCGKLLVNERSKRRFQEGKNDEFGYWYCDECSRKSSNCVFCWKPCRGLAVVVSLSCGHRGHFACLNEWFVAGDNSECPGGCDYKLA